MSYPVNDIAQILQVPGISSGRTISELAIDSRKILHPSDTLFFSLASERRDGHDFIPDAYERGVRVFVIARPIETDPFPDSIFLRVPDTLVALQQLAAHHRSQFRIPVIGITGSNGKTIVKEWLYQLLGPDFTIVRSPRSYNSQIGVPLSVWGMNASHTLGIFEAGISRPGEMDRLVRVIQPTLGVLTHMGPAHDEGFSSRTEKEREKRKLFQGAVVPERIELKSCTRIDGRSVLIAEDGPTITIPFTDDASVENALTCWSMMRHLGYRNEVIADRMLALEPVQMRLEIKQGIRQCLLLNDAYSMDIDSLSIALGYLRQQAGDRIRTVILSDLPGATDDSYRQLIELLLKHGVTRLLAIGTVFSDYLNRNRPGIDPSLRVETFSDRSAFEDSFRATDFYREVILLKGARRFEMEKLLPLLEAQLHQTRLEIDLGALRHNIRAYQSVLPSGVKIMAMVKSFAYGSGGVEIARVMQQEGIAYLGVAYADEGVALRHGGIRLPILVMNAESNAFDSIIAHRLEPVLYSIELLRDFQRSLAAQGEVDFPVHLELETGMHRLGIGVGDYDLLEQALKEKRNYRVRTLFSHLAAGEDPAMDVFTSAQFDQLMEGVRLVRRVCGDVFLVHLANSAAAIRRPEWQLDMVRIGIGLYGIDPVLSARISLRPVARLLATVAQLQELKEGDTVGYNRRSVVHRPTRVATIRLGYADGFPRRLGNGIGSVVLNGRRAPVIGSVCMDMFMVDVSDLPVVRVGDEAIVFGPELPLTELAHTAGTIPYEIMTGISQRVKRVYFEEG